MNHHGSATALSQALPPGTVIGDRFNVQRLLGTGGLGDLYEAVDVKSDRPVALRLFASDLLPDETAADQLRDQVKSASALTHKNIARVFGMGKESSLRYLAMELIDGQNLRQLLERKRQAGRTFSLKGAYNVLAHVCNALAFAHEQQGTVIHGLPGPGAILINRAGRIKLVDFGLARALAPGSSAAARLGDFYAMAPEMHVDPLRAGPAADIYTIGVVLHELLTGQPPTDPPAPMGDLVAGLPRAVEQVVHRCLHPDPSQRLPDPHRLKATFYEAIQGHGVGGSEGISESGAYPALQAGIPVSGAQAVQRVPSQPAQAMPQQRPAQPLHPASSAPQPVTKQLPPVHIQPQPAVPKQVNIEDLLAETDGETAERWLVQKDRLDFGPFTTGVLRRALHKGEFTGEDSVVDQESGQRMMIRQHPAFTEFMRHLDRHLAAQGAKEAAHSAHVADKKRKTVLITVVVVGLVLLAAGGVVAAWLLTRDPEIRYREKIVEKTKVLSSIKGLDVQWKAEPKDQARKRRTLARRPKSKTAGGDDVTRLGDATQAGGDDLLSQKVVQDVMRSNFAKLTGCVQDEWRRNRSLASVDIDFGILGSGVVSTVKVNGKSGGPFHSCIRARMRTIKFPKFDGTLTRASFSMKLRT